MGHVCLMSPADFKAIRLSLGPEWTADRFALALGYGGTKATREVMIYHFESGVKPIPATMKYRLAYLRSEKAIEDRVQKID